MVDYRCSDCGAYGVRLWRPYQSSMRKDSLACKMCTEHRQQDTLKGDEIGWYVPAIHDEADGLFWGYTSVPQYRIEWWRSLPDGSPAPLLRSIAHLKAELAILEFEEMGEVE